MLLLSLAAGHALQPAVAGEAVDRVDHQVAPSELEEALQGLHLVLVGAGADALAGAEGALELVAVDDQQSQGGARKPLLT